MNQESNKTRHSGRYTPHMAIGTRKPHVKDTGQSIGCNGTALMNQLNCTMYSPDESREGMKKMKKNYFNVCENCGSHLDPGETCDCVRKETYTCIYCGAEVEHDKMCKCSQRAKEMERYIRVAALLELDCNIAISIEELRRIAKIAKWKRLDMTYLAYNLGIVMASEVYKRGEQL